MNNTSNCLLLLLGLIALCGVSLADSGTVYGSGLTDGTESVAIAELTAKPEAYVGKRIRIEGRITGVCPKAGCWIDVAGDKPGGKMRVKVNDGEIVFPLDAKGKPVAAEGVLTRIELTHEQAVGWMRHQAEELGEAFDPSKVTGPMTVYQIAGEGAVVR